VAAAAGRRGEHLRPGIANLVQLGKILRALQHSARGLNPVVQEGRLHLRNGETPELVMRIAPVLGGGGVAAPVVGNAGATGEADAAVYDQQLAVRAIVDAAQAVPA